LTAASRQDGPFIRPEEAHLNIGFSCVAYLNTSFRLLPQYSSPDDRRLQVLQGLHGLQIYANQYWNSHVLAYMDLVTAQKQEVPEYFSIQLGEILKYSKAKTFEDTTQSIPTGASQSKNATDQHLSLEKFPGLGSLVSSLETFRTGLKTRDWSQKSIEGR
jgi:hypothetical protein